MEILEDKEFRQKLLKKIEQREFKERKGVHVTDLIYCLNKQALRRAFPQPISDEDLLLFSLGWATQRWLTGQDTDKPEIEVDGIIVTQDASASDVDLEFASAPWELKASYQSSERPVLENTAWFKQIMAQCYVTDTTEAKLSRLEIMGNWKSVFGKKEEKEKPENRKPTLHVWALSFSKSELVKNWQWLKQRRDLFVSLLRVGTQYEGKKFELLPKAMAIPSGQAYECERCVYKGKECTI